MGQVPLLRNYRSALVMQVTFPDKQIKGLFKKIVSQPTFHRMQLLNLETINQSSNICVYNNQLIRLCKVGLQEP